MARTTNYKTWHIILSWEWKIDMKQGHWGRDKMDAFFADDIFKCIFFKENVWISITISLKFVPKGPINNIPALVQIMAWRRPGDKPLSEPMLVGSLTHICVTRPQWVNSSPPSAAYMRQWIRSALVQIMACRLFGTKPLFKPVLGYYQFDPKEKTSVKFESKYNTFHSQKGIWKWRLWNGGHYVLGKISLVQSNDTARWELSQQMTREH